MCWCVSVWCVCCFRVCGCKWGFMNGKCFKDKGKLLVIIGIFYWLMFYVSYLRFCLKSLQGLFFAQNLNMASNVLSGWAHLMLLLTRNQTDTNTMKAFFQKLERKLEEEKSLIFAWIEMNINYKLTSSLPPILKQPVQTYNRHGISSVSSSSASSIVHKQHDQYHHYHHSVSVSLSQWTRNHPLFHPRVNHLQ